MRRFQEIFPRTLIGGADIMVESREGEREINILQGTRSTILTPKEALAFARALTEAAIWVMEDMEQHDKPKPWFAP